MGAWATFCSVHTQLPEGRKQLPAMRLRPRTFHPDPESAAAVGHTQLCDSASKKPIRSPWDAMSRSSPWGAQPHVLPKDEGRMKGRLGLGNMESRLCLPPGDDAGPNSALGSARGERFRSLFPNSHPAGRVDWQSWEVFMCVPVNEGHVGPNLVLWKQPWSSSRAAWWFVLHWWCLQMEAVQLWGWHPAEKVGRGCGCSP